MHTYNAIAHHLFITQVEIQARVDDPHVVKIYETFMLASVKKMVIIMEYCDGGNLLEWIKRCRKHELLNEITILNVFREICMAVYNCHQQKIVHRDIKPENIILSDNCEVVKIVDFGLATDINEPAYIFVRCGTPGFVAPEILKIKDIDHVRLGVESDMFSLGAIYYNLIYGQALFPGKDQNEVLNLNRQCKIKIAPR